MTRDSDMEMRLPNGLNNPEHPVVADFMVGMAPYFADKSAAYEASMRPNVHPVVTKLGATVTPAALQALHDAQPQAD